MGRIRSSLLAWPLVQSRWVNFLSCSTGRAWGKACTAGPSPPSGVMQIDSNDVPFAVALPCHPAPHTSHGGCLPHRPFHPPMGPLHHGASPHDSHAAHPTRLPAHIDLPIFHPIGPRLLPNLGSRRKDDKKITGQEQQWRDFRAHTGRAAGTGGGHHDGLSLDLPCHVLVAEAVLVEPDSVDHLCHVPGG